MDEDVKYVGLHRLFHYCECQLTVAVPKVSFIANPDAIEELLRPPRRRHVKSRRL